MTISKNLTETRSSLANPVLWITFILYLIVLGYTVAHHEPWGDEIHSWNIAKGSTGYLELIHNTRYEGHPPVWYTVLWTISKFTHNFEFVQAIHWSIAAATVFLILFFSAFPLSTKMLLPFGYYFFYEYAVLSRNYAIGILLLFIICIIIRKNFRYKLVVYYLLLLLMSNTHLLAALLAGCLHLYFLVFNIEQEKKTTTIALHVLLGALIFLPAVYFIFPPSDSQLNMQYWFSKWTGEQLKMFGQAPLRSFLPVPAWWDYNFWNTHFLLSAKNKSKLINLLVALLPLILAFFVLRRNKKSLMLFGANLLLSFIVAVIIFPLTSGRYAGFIYISFVAAYWLYCYEAPVTFKNKWWVNSLLILHMAVGVFMVVKDVRLPFSNAYRVNELLNTVPQNERTVTDYWAMNTVSTFADKPFFCVDLQKEVSFLLWGTDLGEMLKRKYRYFDGVTSLFQNEGIKKVYMISTGAPETLKRIDPQLFEQFNVKLADKREGAIEKGGNLYLYLISSY